MSRSGVILSLMALAVAAAAPQARAADRSLATVLTPAVSGYLFPRDAVPMRSWRGVAVLSLQDPVSVPPPSERPGAVPSPPTWQLAVSREGAAPTVLPVRPQRVPFDADIGPGPDGAPQIVYSRCSSDGEGGFPVWPETGCDIYRYDLATRSETKLAVRARAGVDTTLPTIWRDRLAWVGTRGRGVPRVFEGPLDGGPAREVPLVPRRECGYRVFRAAQERRVCRSTISASVRELDLRAGRLVAALTVRGAPGNGNEEIRTARAGGAATLLARTHPGEISVRKLFLAVSQTPKSVGFVQALNYGGDTLYRWDVRRRTFTAARVGRETYGLAPEPAGSLLRIRPIGDPNAQSLALVREPAPLLKPARPPVHDPA